MREGDKAEVMVHVSNDIDRKSHEVLHEEFTELGSRLKKKDILGCNLGITPSATCW